MADDKKFIKGLFKDTGEIDQPQGTWRHAKNIIINEKEGSISNEGGTDYAGHIGTPTNLAAVPAQIFGSQNNKVIGAIEVTSERVILFVVDTRPTDLLIPFHPDSEIGIWDSSTEAYTVVLNPQHTVSGTYYPGRDFLFTTDSPIEGTYKIDAKGDLIIYWTDNTNAPRTLNIDRQLRANNSFGGNVKHIYGILPWSTHNKHIDLLNLFPNSGPIPHIHTFNRWDYQDAISGIYTGRQTAVVEGGGLKTGVYHLALAYVDVDLNATNYVTISNPVSLVDEYDHTRPTTKKDGMKEGSQTSKACVWRVTNLNEDYKYIRPVVIRKMGDAVEAFKLKDMEISTLPPPGGLLYPDSLPYMEVIFSGNETFESAAVEEVIVDTTAYDTAKTLQQLDGILYLGNTTGTKDVGYQKYANNIKLAPETYLMESDPPGGGNLRGFDEVYLTVDNLETGFLSRTVDRFNGVNQVVDHQLSYRYVPNAEKYRGYMRDEIYAFYIAFILTDGSMTYAYHIPGRDIIDNLGGASPTMKELDQPDNFNTAKAFRDLSIHSRNFHFFEYSFTGLWPNCNGMNYWENATERYPSTPDYEIWDENSFTNPFTGTTMLPVGTIQGQKVRHHHFPSNENSAFKAIEADHYCEQELSEGIGAANTPAWTGVLIFYHRNCCYCNTLSNGGNWTRMRFEQSDGANDPAMQAALWVGGGTSRFTADQEMDVTCDYFLVLRQKTTNDPSSPCCARFNSTGVLGAECTDCIGSDDFRWPDCGGGTVTWGPPSCTGGNGSGWLDWDSSNNSGCHSWNGDTGCTGRTFHLQPGESIWVEAHCDGNTDSDVRQANWGEADVDNDCPETRVRFCVLSSAATVPAACFTDLKLSHKVRRLGFSLRDIKIPRSIADKVQGFRIYHADRTHNNRTILGQSAIIPMIQKFEQLGICQEGVGNSDAIQINSTLQDLPEQFWIKDPTAVSPWAYSTPLQFIDDSDGTWYTNTFGCEGPPNTCDYAYEIFSFHDFYLLRSKESITPATHYKNCYRVKNIAFNGPGLDQEKRMQTKLVEDESTDPKMKVPKEEWGWDAQFNCYPQRMHTAIFAGVLYQSGYRSQNGGSSNGFYRYPRMLGQKAKTYLLGDSIFNGTALGFGGKLFNEFGESCIALGFADEHEMYADSTYNRPGWNQNLTLPISAPGCPQPNEWGDYMHNTGLFPSLAINEINASGVPGARSAYNIGNLVAFKTDLYKSVDTQNLIWTGWECLGDDMENFVFDEPTLDNGWSGSASTDVYYRSNGSSGNTADYRTKTLDSSVWDKPLIDKNIYGGDTYICRYGFASHIKPSDASSPSNPRKALHYYITEGTDNINFRHEESSKSMYFPGSVAKNMLISAGVDDHDFTHVDNMKYNSNYSENNDLRPAFPLPVLDTTQDEFPTRVHRSAKADTSSIIDNYRVFLANQFKDLPKNRGDLWKLSAFNNLLYFHMEETLFKATGKQTMQMGDGSDAYLGSGDLFEQEPTEIISTDGGYGGTQSQWAAITTRHGYFFVNAATRKVFLMRDKLVELSDLGMKQWFQDNLSTFDTLSQFGVQEACMGGLDNPIAGTGLHTIWDPKYRRIILTKRQIDPTQLLIDSTSITSAPPPAGAVAWIADECVFKVYFPCIAMPPPAPPCNPWTPISWDDPAYFTKGGWTISYYPELNIWSSFHTYIPYIYFNTSTDFYSMTDQYPVILTVNDGFGTTYGNTAIWKHNSDIIRGVLYQEDAHGHIATFNGGDLQRIFHDCVFEFIHNETSTFDVLTANIGYTCDVENEAGVRVLEHGWTSFFLYNTFQVSGDGTQPNDILEYLVNIRRIGNHWKINRFRDLSADTTQTAAYYTSPNLNVIGQVNTGTLTTSNTQSMFTETGMTKTVTAGYLNLNKTWDQQRKFIDKWIGIRLIYDNIENNLLNLYSTKVEQRKFYR